MSTDVPAPAPAPEPSPAAAPTPAPAIVPTPPAAPVAAAPVVPVGAPPTVDPGSGWLSPEFWSTLAGAVANILGVMVATGMLSIGDSQVINTELASMLSGAELVAVNGFLFWNYVRGQQSVRMLHMKHVHERAMMAYGYEP